MAQGEALDNGQHVLIGAYAELFGLMQRVGVPSDALLRMPLELRYAGGFALRALWLPPRSTCSAGCSPRAARRLASGSARSVSCSR